jgi:hypothetical protein
MSKITKPSSFAEDWARTVRLAEEAKLTNKEIEAAIGLSERSYQRYKNQPGGPKESKRTREILAALKVTIPLKLRRKVKLAAAATAKLRRIAKDHSVGFVWGAVAIGTVAAVAGGWLCFCDDFGFGLMSGLGDSI